MSRKEGKNAQMLSSVCTLWQRDRWALNLVSDHLDYLYIIYCIYIRGFSPGGLVSRPPLLQILFRMMGDDAMWKLKKDYYSLVVMTQSHKKRTRVGVTYGLVCSLKYLD